MESRAALGAAAAIALTVTGGVSALFLAIGQAGADGATDGSVTDPAVMVEYVDENGNPVAEPAGAMSTANTPEIILVNPDGTLVNQTPAAMAETPYGAEEYEEEEYEEGEEYEEEDYEEGEEYEEEEEYEDHEDEEEYEGDEYAAGEHEEDDHEEEEDHEDD